MNATRPIQCRTRSVQGVVFGIFSLVFILACGCANETPANGGSNPVGLPESSASGVTASALPTGNETPPEKSQTTPVSYAAIEQDGATPQGTFARDLKYVPEYALAVLVVRPARILALEGVKNLPGVDLAGMASLKPSDVDRLVLTLVPDSGESVRYGFIVETFNAIERQKLIDQLSPGAQPYGNEGKIFLSASNRPGQGLSLAFPDNKTVVVANSNFGLFQMLQSETAGNRETRILKAYARNDHKAQISAAVDVDRLRHTMDIVWPREDAAAGEFGVQELVLGMPHSVKTAALSWSLEAADGLSIRIDTAGDQLKPLERAESVRKLIEQLRAGFGRWQGRTVDESLKKDVQSTNELLQTIVDQLEPAADGRVARIRSGQMPAAAESVQLIAKAMALATAAKRRQEDFEVASHHLALLGLSIHNHLASSGEFPRDITSADGKPLLSWRVRLLKSLDLNLGGLYEEFHLDEPWDSPHNKKLIARMPDAYRSRDSKPSDDKTHLLAIDGKGTVFGEKLRKLDEITDGPGNTLALVEAKESVVWTKPADLSFDPKDPRAGLRPQSALAIFYDGRGAEILATTSDDAIRHACLHADGGGFSGASLAKKRSSRAYESKQLVEKDVEEILAKIKNGSREAKRAALFQLRIHRVYDNKALAQKVIDALVELAGTKDPNVRLWALEALNEWAEPRTVDWKKLAPVLDDPYDKNRWLAINILGTTGEAEVARRLFDLPRQDSMARNAAWFGGLKNVAADASVPVLKSDDKLKKLNAIYLIASTGDRSHVEQLKKLLVDEDEDCRKAARFAIDKLRSGSR